MTNYIADLDALIWHGNADAMAISADLSLRDALEEARSSSAEWIVLVWKDPVTGEISYYAFRYDEFEALATGDPAQLAQSVEDVMEGRKWTCSGVTRDRSLVGNWAGVSGPAARRVVDLGMSGEIRKIGEIRDATALHEEQSYDLPDYFDDLLGLEPVGAAGNVEKELATSHPAAFEGIDPALSPQDYTRSDDMEPPRSAYGLLDCPDEVKPMTEFVVTVGLAENPTPGVIGGPMHRPDWSVGDYELSITLKYDGFLLKAGEVNQVALDVTAHEPYPTKKLHLTAVAGESFKLGRSLLAEYSVEGQLIGSATRTIIVRDDVREGIPARPAGGFDLSMPPGIPTPDMTISITQGNTVGDSRLVWSVLTPHKTIDTTLPEDEGKYKLDIGSTPEEWARDLMNAINAYPVDKPLESMMFGNGKEIRHRIPLWVQRKLLELSKLVDDPERLRPSVFIVSDEPYIPWELAYLKLEVPNRKEEFLGAAFVVGRWVHGHEEVDGTRVPAYPPPIQVKVGKMAVVSGDYSGTKMFGVLEGAEEEAKQLVAGGAVHVNADSQLADWLSKRATVDAIHFAVHGKWSTGGWQNGIVLVDGTTLTSKEIMGVTLARRPFVFLNACQLGQGEKVLGDYGGIARAFLDAGASGVVSALWNIDDKEAKDLALDFYDQAKSGQVNPAEIFRKRRSSFRDGARSKLALAYQFFGHPHLHVMLNLS